MAKKIENIDIPRFLSKIVKSSTSDCWDFKSCKVKGYSVFNSFYAHRVSYSVFKKELSSELVVDHKCRNRACVNPEHLREVTHETNIIENSEAKSALNKLKSHCKHGHEFNSQNTVIRRDGNRLCSTCRTIYNRKKSEQISKQRFNLGLPSKWKGGGLL